MNTAIKDFFRARRVAGARHAATTPSTFAWAAALCLAAGAPAHAEEGGAGHYIPGTLSSFIDVVPPSETFLARLNVVHYDGSYGRSLPFAGLTVANANVKSTGYGLTMLWRPPLELAPNWSYAMSATIPYVTMQITGDVRVTTVGASQFDVQRSGRTSGLGDVVLMPLMLNYVVDPDLSVNFRTTFYAPTGSYELGRLANPGKNYWTFEPTLGLAYLGKDNGIEATLFAGVSYNRENPATHYKTGTQVHVDGTLAQHLPAAGGLLGLGLNAYYYQQVTGDSGTGATFGDFKGESVGLGPVISFVKKIGGHDTITELKWLHEASTENRLKGDFVWLKFLYKFY